MVQVALRSLPAFPAPASHTASPCTVTPQTAHHPPIVNQAGLLNRPGDTLHRTVHGKSAAPHANHLPPRVSANSRICFPKPGLSTHRSRTNSPMRNGRRPVKSAGTNDGITDSCSAGSSRRSSDISRSLPRSVPLDVLNLRSRSDCRTCKPKSQCPPQLPRRSAHCAQSSCSSPSHVGSGTPPHIGQTTVHANERSQTRQSHANPSHSGWVAST